MQTTIDETMISRYLRLFMTIPSVTGQGFDPVSSPCWHNNTGSVERLCIRSKDICKADDYHEADTTAHPF